MQININKEDNMNDYDDCEVCKLMKKGDHNYGDLAEAFAKQNAKNKLNEEISRENKE